MQMLFYFGPNQDKKKLEVVFELNLDTDHVHDWHVNK